MTYMQTENRWLQRCMACVRSLGVVAALFCVAFPAQMAYAGPATDALKGTIDQVLQILHDKDLKQPAKAGERRQLLERVVGERFDYPEMSRRALGAPWNTLSDKDRQEFVGLF